MRNFKNLLLISFILGNLLFLNSCKNDSYTESLPNSSGIVGFFDLKAMVLKAGDNVKDPALIDALKKEFSSPKEQDFLNEFIKDPESCGLSFTDKIYFFLDSTTSKGFLSKVKDADDLKKTILTLNPETTFNSENGVNYTCLQEKEERPANPYLLQESKVKENITVAFNDDRCIILYGGDKDLAIKLLNQKGKQPLNEASGMNELLNSKKDISILYLPEKSIEKEQYNAISPGFGNLIEQLTVTGISYLVDVSFEKGQIDIDVKLMADNNKKEEVLKKSLGGNMKGNLLGKVPEKSLGNIGFNLTNTSIINDMLLECNKAMPFTTNIDSLSNAINSIKGDVLFSLEDMNMTPAYTVLIETESTQLGDFLINTLKEINGQEAVTVEEDLYSFNNNSLFVYNKNNLLAVTTNANISSSINNGCKPSLADAPYAGIYKDACTAGYIDIKSIIKQVYPIQNDYISHLSFNGDNTDSSLQIVMQDSQKNSLTTIFEMVKFFTNLQ